MTTHARALVLLAFVASTSGCGGGGAIVDAATGGADLSGVRANDLGVAVLLDLSGPADLVSLDVAVDPFGPYPAGPYGNQVGDVIPPLDWEGYVVPRADAVADTTPYRTYSMDALRRSGARYGLVHVAEYT